jgi:hypothetical protein
MSLLDVVRNAIKVADTVTKPLQPTVTLRRMSAPDGMGARTLVAAKSLRAIVEYQQVESDTQSGTLTLTKATEVLFLDAAALAGATGGVGVREFDEIVLPDGTTGQISMVTGFVDAGTGKPIPTRAVIG